MAETFDFRVLAKMARRDAGKSQRRAVSDCTPGLHARRHLSARLKALYRRCAMPAPTSFLATPII